MAAGAGFGMDDAIARPRRPLAYGLAALCAALLALLCALVLTGCGDSDARARSAIEESIEGDMARLQSLTADDAARIFASDYTTELSGAGVDLTAVYGPMFSSLAYTIDGVTVSGDEASVAMTVTNKDLTAALQSYTDAVTAELATGESRAALAALSDDELVRHLAEVLEGCLSSADLPLVTTQVTLSYTKDGSSWKLSNSAELAQALLGGLDVASLLGEGGQDGGTAAAADTGAAGADATAAADLDAAGAADAAAGLGAADAAAAAEAAAA